MLERFAWVCAECSFQALYAGQSFADEGIAWLRERGLRLAGVYHMAYDERGRAVQADFFVWAVRGLLRFVITDIGALREDCRSHSRAGCPAPGY
ncbi:MAG: hypothetical protein AB1671_28685 [Thermodesulfobacteriota bacterium]